MTLAKGLLALRVYTQNTHLRYPLDLVPHTALCGTNPSVYRSRFPFVGSLALNPVMANSKSPSPRASRADRPPSTHHSSHNISPHPPRSSKRYPSLRMAAPPGLDASNPSSPPGQRHAHPAISPHPSQRRSSKGSIGSDRPPTPVSRGSIKNSHSSAQLATQSTLLQEKLQQERRHEIQRSLTRLAGEMGDANESRAAPATPTRCVTVDGQRPDLMGDINDGKAKGFSLIEMGQVLPSSSLTSVCTRSEQTNPFLK